MVYRPVHLQGYKLRPPLWRPQQDGVGCLQREQQQQQGGQAQPGRPASQVGMEGGDGAEAAEGQLQLSWQQQQLQWAPLHDAACSVAQNPQWLQPQQMQQPQMLLQEQQHLLEQMQTLQQQVLSAVDPVK